MLKGAGFVMLVSVMFFLLGFMGVAAIGDGHGTAYLFVVVTAPFSGGDDIWLGLAALCLFWPMVGLMIALRRWAVCALVGAILLLGHYAGIVWLHLVGINEWSYIDKLFGPGLVILIPWLAVYVGMNMWFWRMLWPRLRELVANLRGVLRSGAARHPRKTA